MRLQEGIDQLETVTKKVPPKSVTDGSKRDSGHGDDEEVSIASNRRLHCSVDAATRTQGAIS